MLGGDGRDSLHGGAGADIMNGDGDSVGGEDPIPDTDDEDHLFGGDGPDVMWGGRGNDHLWGGHGDDHLDVRPRPASPDTVADPPEWFAYGEPDNYQGLDIIYGGWDRDALQADEASPGPGDVDTLIDWTGGYNVFYVCPGAYGQGTIIRQGNPALTLFLQDLAEGDGALLPHESDTCGFREVGYVFPKDRRDNSHPPHPDHPGHFVCDDGTVRFVEE
jgi:Ca2+-binding RTX toxin-like protein